MLARRRTKKAKHPQLWQVKEVWPGNGELAQQLKVPELIAQLLFNRGVSDLDSAQSFLQPSLNDLADPERFTQMSQAVQRIKQAIERDEKIVIYGDYDVDGITSVAILWHCFRLAGKDVEFYVPHRIDEGYGLSVEAIGQLAQKGAQLIITVDCGVTAVDQASEAARLGVDLIITDHHKIEGDLPEAVAVLHPDLPGEDYPCRHLCGAGVAFKLAWALSQEFSGSKKVSDEFRDFLISATALAGLGTIADVVPLSGENRVLAHFGMRGLSASDDLGIRALIEASGLTGTQLDSFDIGFKLAPRLNAAGRMGHARLAVELFTKSSEDRAREIAAYLESQNRLRQKVEKQITEEALAQVKALEMDKDDFRAIVVASENWHAGVIGIVASRIVDACGKPTAVISIQGDTAMGSCRSVEGFNICAALENCSEHLMGFGGHEMAAGLTCQTQKIEEIRQAFNAYGCENFSEQDFLSRLDIDAEVRLTSLDLATVTMIGKLGPFGSGNPRVLLVGRNLRLINPPRSMGKRNEHLQFLVAHGDDETAQNRSGGVLRAVAFHKSNWAKILKTADSFDLVFQPMINHFNGNSTVELLAEDIQVNQ